jgi:hypothetical protein
MALLCKAKLMAVVYIALFMKKKMGYETVGLKLKVKYSAYMLFKYMYII